MGLARGYSAESLRPYAPFSLESALSDAHTLAARHTGAQVVRVEGRSMLPFFGDGSVLVVKGLSAAQVRPGMVVVYQNRFGETVAHRVIAPAPGGGWVVRGYNNAEADTTIVDEANLVGVVYATFYSNGRATDADLLASLTQGTLLALAAPAK
ncbi:MAG TPA: signal peptidase I [Opitutaceae bacterium]